MFLLFPLVEGKRGHVFMMLSGKIPGRSVYFRSCGSATGGERERKDAQEE